jgi:hypothetical protein
MDRQLHVRLRKQMSFYLSTGLIIGSSREKSVASRPKSRVCWTEIVKKSFNDQQWIENFRMSKETFTYICNRLNEKGVFTCQNQCVITAQHFTCQNQCVITAQHFTWPNQCVITAQQFTCQNQSVITAEQFTCQNQSVITDEQFTCQNKCVITAQQFTCQNQCVKTAQQFTWNTPDSSYLA